MLILKDSKEYIRPNSYHGITLDGPRYRLKSREHDGAEYLKRLFLQMFSPDDWESKEFVRWKVGNTDFIDKIAVKIPEYFKTESRTHIWFKYHFDTEFPYGPIHLNVFPHPETDEPAELIMLMILFSVGGYIGTIGGNKFPHKKMYEDGMMGYKMQRVDFTEKGAYFLLSKINELYHNENSRKIIKEEMLMNNFSHK